MKMNRAVLLALGATFVGACVDVEDDGFVDDSAVSARGLQFFSQTDPSWKNDQLGRCVDETIGSAGCAITAVAMAMTSLGADVDPGTLNEYLTDHNGYAEGCLVFWAQAAEMDGAGGVEWVHTGVLGSPEALRAGLDQGKRVIAESTRYSRHWVYIVSYDGGGDDWSDFSYWDPIDGGPIDRRIGDGWVVQGASTRVYR